MTMLEELKWSLHAGDWYVFPDDIEHYQTCPICEQKPKVWIFDNGSFAKCWCHDLYEPGVQSQSIMDVFRQDGNASNYSRKNLMLAWNRRVSMLDK